MKRNRLNSLLGSAILSSTISVGLFASTASAKPEDGRAGGCQHVRGGITDTEIPSPNDLLGRVLGNVDGVLNGAATTFLTSFNPGAGGVLNATSFDVLLRNEGDMLTATCANMLAPVRGKPPQPHFVCNAGYSAELCRRQTGVLRGVLARYPSRALGEWTWVLVRSKDWKPMKRRLRRDPDSPAFTILRARRTFIEEALVAPAPGRSAELIGHWSRSMDDLLALAITHELGHALCDEQDEHKADANGRLLRTGRLPDCR
jgi:hypothetical protein